MRRDIEVLIFYPDGNPPNVFNFKASSLSEKWIGVCAELLNELGPVFKQTLAGNLSDFGIHMAGPMGRLLIREKACFEFRILRSSGDEQDRATLVHFRAFLSEACATVGHHVTDDAMDALSRTTARPTLLLFDYCADVGEVDKTAIAQLGLHLTAAYLAFCDAADEAGNA